MDERSTVTRAQVGALACGLVAACVAFLAYWLYGLLLLVAGLIAVALVTRPPRLLRRSADGLPPFLRRGVGFGAATAAAMVVIMTVVAVAPAYVLRQKEGDRTRARILVEDADHELDSRDFETARLYLDRAVDADPDVEGVEAVEERMRKLQAR